MLVLGRRFGLVAIQIVFEAARGVHTLFPGFPACPSAVVRLVW
jgi:hypothetical protein